MTALPDHVRERVQRVLNREAGRLLDERVKQQEAEALASGVRRRSPGAHVEVVAKSSPLKDRAANSGAMTR
jgi:hypothetical protein